MPKRSNTTTSGRVECFCDICGSGGQLFSPNAYTAHLLATRQRREQQVTHEALMAEAIVSGLTDDGPDLDTQPDKLWSSRAEFQHHASHQHSSGQSDLEGFIESLQGMSLNGDDDMPADQQRPPLHDESNTVRSQQSDSNPSQISRPHFSSLDKREKHHSTTKAKRVVERIQVETQKFREQLTSEPSHETLLQIESEISSMRKSLETQTRVTPHLVKLRKEASGALERLEARVFEWRIAVPVPMAPMSINNGMYIHPCT
jgi:hypothetical protein